MQAEDLRQIGDLIDARLDKRFAEFAIIVNKGFENTLTKEELIALELRINGKINNLDERLIYVENHMVTKYYLEERLMQFAGQVENSIKKMFQSYFPKIKVE